MNRPTVLYPTISTGFVYGDILRLESIEGDQLEISTSILKTYPEFLYSFPGVARYETFWRLEDAGPFTYAANQWCVTHLQKYSPRGWLKTSPDCYHRWWFWKLQQKDVQGNWLPGTERGLYFRKPFSWRWQADAKEPWVWTKGYLGGHWD